VSRKLARASEVRKLFDLRSNARVYELARRNMLPGVVRLGRQVRFDMVKIRSFIEEGGHHPQNTKHQFESKWDANVVGGSAE
jgi:hypothetical protein